MEEEERKAAWVWLWVWVQWWWMFLEAEDQVSLTWYPQELAQCLAHSRLPN